MLELFAALAAGYLLGGVPSAAIMARLKGHDIFTVGSGNMGSMNTARNLGLGLGVLVLALDVGKGALATFLGMQMAVATGQVGVAALLPALLAGFGAVLGHAFSPYVGFKGGKGLATTFGVSLPLYPFVGLFALGLILSLYLLTRRMELAALVTILAYPLVALLLMERRGWEKEATFMLVTGLLPLVVVVLLKHVLAWRAERGTGAETG